MRSQDRAVFGRAARFFYLWILVRRTNDASLEYVGLKKYTAKPMACKAKTADITVDRNETAKGEYGKGQVAEGRTLKDDLSKFKSVRRFITAGLVVDPRIHQSVFKGGKLKKALECWADFEKILNEDKRFSVELNPAKQHFGCVMFEDKYVHGDYDLYDIVDPRMPYRNLALLAPGDHGMTNGKARHVELIAQYVNQTIGVPMVLHGGEAQWVPDDPDKRIDFSDQIVDVFGPAGEQFELYSKEEFRRFYDTQFEGRPILGSGRAVTPRSGAGLPGPGATILGSHDPEFWRRGGRGLL